MLRKTFSCSELCSRWDISQRDLRAIVNNGKLRALNDIYSLVEKKDNAYFYIDNRMVGAGAVCTGGPLPITDENGFYFNISDVEAFERENGTPHVLMTDHSQQGLTENPLATDAQEKLLDKKSIPKPRASILVEEARRLHRDYPKMNRVEAKKKIDAIIENHKYPRYSRTQFNRIIKGIGFPPGSRGRKPANKKK